MYHYSPIEHLPTIEKYVNEWLANTENSYINIQEVVKPQKEYTNIKKQNGDFLVLKNTNTTIGILIEGILPDEMQKIADNLEGYQSFENAQKALEFIQKITTPTQSPKEK